MLDQPQLLQEYAIVETLSIGNLSAVFRASAANGDGDVVLKTTLTKHPSLSETLRIHHEHNILSGLNSPFVPRCLDLQRVDGRPVLVLEYVPSQTLGARPLPLPVGEFLVVANQLVEAVRGVHEHGVIHGDIHPSNILFDHVSQALRLIDFNVSTRLRAEWQSVQVGRRIQGTLHYMAPEQTGRTNRSIDYRADFYAMGVVFYQLLTGTLPFEAEDSLGLIHQHLAQTPRKVHECVADVPVELSAIVDKLLAKAADNRYQSSRGILADLRLAQGAWETRTSSRIFVAGGEDVSERLNLPQRLYGRAAELARLQAAVAEAGDGATKLVLVAGAPGIGKSVLVHELSASMATQGGRLATGKFDLLQRNIPHKAVLDALSEVLRSILAASDEDSVAWSEVIADALAPNGRVIADVIPELEHLIGEQPPVPELGATETANRFQETLRAFVRSLVHDGRPLLLFLDDVQWSDQASLDFIRNVVSDPGSRNLVIIGAYRDSDIESSPAPAGDSESEGAAEPTVGRGLATMVASLEADGFAIERITLERLSADAIGELLADALARDRAEVADLAGLIQQKTDGNPFFIRQFLTLLYREQLLCFDRTERTWSWDMAAIEQSAITDNVADATAGRLRGLEERTRSVLQVAAFLGNRFTFSRMQALMSDTAPADIAAGLVLAVDEGTLGIDRDGYRWLQLLHRGEVPDIDASGADAQIGTIELVFLHDRIQRAAAMLVPEGERAALHRRIGRALMGQLGDDLRSEQLFAVVDHFQSSESLLTDEREITAVAALSLEAARRARSSCAYDAAVTNARFSQRLLERMPGGIDRLWRTDYTQALALATVRMQSESLAGNHELVAEMCRELTPRTTDLPDRAALVQIVVMQGIRTADLVGALGHVRAMLETLGLTLPEGEAEQGAAIGAELGAIAQALGARAIPELGKAAPMNDGNTEVTIGYLRMLFRLAYLLQQPALATWALLRATQLCVTHGICRHSDYVYGMYGFLLHGAFGQPDAGAQFGHLSIALAERNPYPELRATVYSTIPGMLNHWNEPLRECRPLVEIGYQLAHDSGDFENMAYAINIMNTFDWLGGEPLHEWQPILTEHLADLARVKTDFLNPAISAGSLYMAERLMDLEPAFKAFRIEGNEFLSHSTAELRLAACLDEPIEVVEALLARIPELVMKSPGLPFVWESVFCGAFLAARYALVSGDERARALQTISREHLQTLRGWAERSSATFEHKVKLVEAELAAAEPSPWAAVPLYEEAMNGAARSGFVHDEALTAERAGRFWMKHGMDDYARVCLLRARAAYDRWGAAVKVHALDAELGNSRQRARAQTQQISTGGSSATMSSLFGALDVQSAIKASVSIAQEILLPRLLGALLHVVMESAGAERAAIVIPGDIDWVVVAEGAVDEEPAVYEGDEVALASWTGASRQAIRYVQRSREILVIGDAQSAPMLADDPYIQQNVVHSLLCLPVVKQGELTAIVYLENRLAVDTFTDERVALLQLLSGQIAISMENARLYAQLERAFAESRSTERLKHGFLATVSHELRTPLNAIVNMPSIIRDSLPESFGEQDAYLEIIQESGYELLRVIDRIIDFSQLEAEVMPFAPQQQALGAIVSAVTGRFTATAAEKQISIQTQVPQGDVGVFGDPKLISKMLSHLVANAIKFSSRTSTVVVAVTATARFALMEVRDSGVGIPEDSRAFIFDSFRQGSEGANRSHGGTGLGLAITKRLVDLHGGEIALHSETGKGTSFTIRLPRSAPAH